MEADTEPRLAGFGHSIYRRRRALALTQSQLGDRVGWSQDRISSLQHDTAYWPDLPSLAALADAVALSIIHEVCASGYGWSITPPAVTTAEYGLVSRTMHREARRPITGVDDHLADARSLLDQRRRRTRYLKGVVAHMAGTAPALRGAMHGPEDEERAPIIEVA